MNFRIFFFCILSLLIPSLAHAYSEPSGSWTFYPSIGVEPYRMFSGPKTLYAIDHLQSFHSDDPSRATHYSAIHKYDKEQGELQTLSPVSGLAGYLPLFFEYNPDKEYLFVAYDDANIDLIYDSGEIVNIPGLRNADAINDKNINSVTFDKESDLIYVATNFGFFTINDKKHEIARSYIYRRPIKSVVRAGEFIVAADQDGNLFSAPISAPLMNWNEFTALPGNSHSVAQLVPLEGNRCAALAPDRNATVLMLVDLDNSSIRDLRTTYNTFWQFAPDRRCFIGSNNRGIMLNSDGNFEMITIPEPEISRYTPMASMDLKNFWFMDEHNRFYMRKRTDNNGDITWTDPTLPILPVGPKPFRISDIALHPEYGYLVPNHGITSYFPSQSHPEPLMLSALRTGGWDQFGLEERNPAQLNAFANPSGMAIDPDNPNLIYFGSLLNGLVRINLADPDDFLHFSFPKDEWKDLPGFVNVHSPSAKWKNLSQLSNPVIDNQGTLWFVYNDYDSEYRTQIWGWTAESRNAARGTSSVRPFFKIKLNNPEVTLDAKVTPLSAPANKNIIIYNDVATNGNIWVIDHNGTPDITTDDRHYTISYSTVRDTDGESLDSSLAYTLTEDPATGLVWVGTDSGVFSFSPTGALAGNPMVRQYKIARNDGTGLADYLLSGVAVNDIAIDKRNRKWFATDGAGIVCVDPNATEIITSCDTGNSDIPSDLVYRILYNPNENLMMVATDAGLASYRPYNVGDGTDFEYARAYPNPVRPDYLGYVTIDGLADNAIVKITDAHGRMVRELGFAANGVVRWDVADMTKRRVGSGVYFVMASTGPDDASLSKVTKILVIN